MDHRLLNWARAVKSRRRWRRDALPPLWLFTDPVRGSDVLRAVAGLPRGLCGVVFRHDGEPGRAPLAKRVWQICRNRRLAMVIAGKRGGVPGAGQHLRDGSGRWNGGCCSAGLTTSSAHGAADLRRAGRAGAALAFLSPVFPTLSHPGAAALGPLRWAGLARRSLIPAYALGGIDGATVRRLPRWALGAGAIGALQP